MPQTSAAWSALNDQLIDALSYLWWCLVGGLIAMSLGWNGGVAALDALQEWREEGPPRRRTRRRDEIALEAERGMRQIETFLADLEERHGWGK